MKKRLLLFVVLGTLLATSCKKEVSINKRLSFIEFRELVDSVSRFTLIDDSNAQMSKLFLDNELLSFYHWQNGIYSGSIIPTRVIWSSYDKYEFVFISDDLAYTRLIVLCPNQGIKDFDVCVVKLIKADLVINRDSIFLKILYNNSWIRTGPMPDIEKNIAL